MDQVEIIGTVYQAAAQPQLWPQVLCAIVDYIGATAGNIVYQSPKGHGSFLIPGRMRDDLNALYLQHYARNPYARAFEKVRPGQIEVGNRLVDAPAIRRSAYYTDICAPQDIFNQLFVPHASLHERGGIGGVALFLSRRQDEHVGRAVDRLTRLAPHLMRAMDLSLQSGQLDRGAELSRRLVYTMQDAAILLNGRGEIMFMNATAESLLRDGDGLYMGWGDSPALVAADSAASASLTLAIRQALATARGSDSLFDGVLPVSRRSGLPPYLVMVTPLAPATLSLWDTVDNGARVLVQIVDPAAKTARQAQHLGRMFGLTEAETRVAAMIGSGLTQPEIANLLGVSVNTVKTHTSRCFAKTDVRTQAAHARLIAAIPLPDKTAPG